MKSFYAPTPRPVSQLNILFLRPCFNTPEAVHRFDENVPLQRNFRSAN